MYYLCRAVSLCVCVCLCCELYVLFMLWRFTVCVCVCLCCVRPCFTAGVATAVCVCVLRALRVYYVCVCWIGYASRRAMLQQLHGVTMYSHDEHHTSTYSWTERGKGGRTPSASHHAPRPVLSFITASSRTPSSRRAGLVSGSWSDLVVLSVSLQFLSCCTVSPPHICYMCFAAGSKLTFPFKGPIIMKI